MVGRAGASTVTSEPSVLVVASRRNGSGLRYEQYGGTLRFASEFRREDACEWDAQHRPQTAGPADPVEATRRTTRTDARRKPLRKDAQRNREALLVAAAEAYGERGIDASLEDIARRAGVGIGTLYRHFPTRDALTEAVYRREVQTLCDGVDELIASREPVDALRAWMISFAGYVAKKRGMAMALKAHFGPDSELFTTSRARIHAAVDAVVPNAVDAGVDPSGRRQQRRPRRAERHLHGDRHPGLERPHRPARRPDRRRAALRRPEILTGFGPASRTRAGRSAASEPVCGPRRLQRALHGRC